MHDALEAVLKKREAEINQETERFASESEVGEQLLAMHRVVLLGGLEFDDDLMLNDQIGAEALVERDTVETNGNRHLAEDVKTAFLQAMAEEDFVNRLKQSRAKFRMQLVGLIDNDAADFVDLHRRGGACFDGREAVALEEIYFAHAEARRNCREILRSCGI